MKKYKNHIIGFLLLAGVSFLFGFAGERNSVRKIEKINIEFTNAENLYITEKAVNNLLIQNEIAISNVQKEILDLNKVEKILDENDMIENAEVYVSIDGQIGAKITQRKPIGRIFGSKSFYVDDKGEKMPLSKYYSARVPLLFGISEKELKEVFPLLNYIEKDEFLIRNITEINRESNGFYELKVRGLKAKILFGGINNIALKFNNFKAFYQNVAKNNNLDFYKTVNLQFGNQVVATKK